MEDVAVEMMRAFQKYIIQNFLSPMYEGVAELFELNANEKAMMELMKPGYGLGGLVPTLDDHTKEKYFIQEPKTYRKRLQQIFRTVETGDDMVLKICFALASGCQKEVK